MNNAATSAAAFVMVVPPPWLQPGFLVRSPLYGQGIVLPWLDDSLLVKFPGYSIPIQFKNWQMAIAEGQIVADGPLPMRDRRASEADIQAIPHPQFRAIATELASNLNTIVQLPPAPGVQYPISQDLPIALQMALKQLGIHQLYSHQLEALSYLRRGYDLSLVTPTASGKTLCYNLAILEGCLNHPQSTALYLFPLKALAFDQFCKLQRLVEALPLESSIKVGQLTGDTPFHQRLQLFVPHLPHILALSPDLLHYQLEKVRRLEAWQPWREFLRRLRWVVIDEGHSYLGAFGAHFVNLLRRLQRAVDSVGGHTDHIQFICASATVGNPQALAMQFSGRISQPERLHCIEHSGAASAGKTILCMAPTQAANPEACKIILSWLKQDLSGLVFCNSRHAVKGLLGLIQREATRQGQEHLAQKLKAFYGSLKRDYRQTTLHQLRTGQLKVIIATSALEAGLDLPEVDCCLLRGYPGSIMSFHQRLGRAGRKNPGLVIFLPVSQNPLDRYYGQYPEQLLSGAVETVVFNPNYPTTVRQHLECCATESGLPVSEVEARFGQIGITIAEKLLHHNKLQLSPANTLWGKGYPHQNVRIRGNALDSVVLTDATTGEGFEVRPLDMAYREVFPGAIYMAADTSGHSHHLIAYQCQSLHLETKQAILKPLQPDPGFCTQADSALQIKLLQPLESPRILSTAFLEGRLRLTLCWGEITSLVTGYKLLHKEYQLTCTNLKCRNHYQPLHAQSCPACHRSLHLREMTKIAQETGFSPPYQVQYQAPVVKIEVNSGIVHALSREVNQLKARLSAKYPDLEQVPEAFKCLFQRSPVAVALHSMAHQIQFAVPLAILCSSHDVNCFIEEDNAKVVAYFFDTADGGNGAAEAIGKHLPQFAQKAQSLAKTCNCEQGCPRCLIHPGCPQQNEALHKHMGLFLLEGITLEGIA